MPDQPQSPETPQEGAAETLFYWLPRDEVLARKKDGWQSQIFQPNAGQWVDYPELDVAGEGTEISADEIRELLGGEFASAALELDGPADAPAAPEASA